MAKYLLLYHGGSQPASAEEGAKIMTAWTSWMGSLGSALVDAGNPTGDAKTIAPGGKVSAGGGANPTTGYSILEAASADAAATLAKGCPHLVSGGTVEVAEIMPIM